MPTVVDPKDIPGHLQQVLAHADALIRQGDRIVHFKYTCGKCGARQTFEEPNQMFSSGLCEECQHETNLFDPAANVGFMLVVLGGAVTMERSETMN